MTAEDAELAAGATANGGPARKRGRVPGSGRPKGGVNKVTREFREVVRDMLQRNAENMSLWLASVAAGDVDAGRPPIRRRRSTS